MEDPRFRALIDPGAVSTWFPQSFPGWAGDPSLDWREAAPPGTDLVAGAMTGAGLASMAAPFVAKLSPVEAFRRLMKYPLKEVVDRYKAIEKNPDEHFGYLPPGGKAMLELGPDLITTTRGSLELLTNPKFRRAFEKGIGLHIEDNMTTLKPNPSGSSTAKAWPYETSRGMPVGSSMHYPVSELIKPGYVIYGGRREGSLEQRVSNWLKSLLHEGGHIKYGLDPEVAKEVIRRTEPYHRSVVDEYGEPYRRVVQREAGTGHYPYTTGPTRAFEESLVDGIAKVALKRTTGRESSNLLRISDISPLYHDTKLLEELERIFYGR